MTTELIRQLRAWGFHMSGGRPDGAEKVAPDVHPLSKAREFAPMTRQRAARLLAGRDGSGRRKLMAQAINATSGYPDLKTVRIAPVWSCDPVRCKQTGGNGGGGYVQPEVPDDLKWIDRALAQIGRDAPVRAMVLRTELIEGGSHRRKAGVVSEAYGGNFTVRQYRYELQRAMDFMRGTVVEAA